MLRFPRVLTNKGSLCWSCPTCFRIRLPLPNIKRQTPFCLFCRTPSELYASMHANDTIELTEQGNHRWLALYYPCICIAFSFSRIHTDTLLSLVWSAVRIVSLFMGLYILGITLSGRGRIAGEICHSVLSRKRGRIGRAI
jgi:hypothetical protein